MTADVEHLTALRENCGVLVPGQRLALRVTGGDRLAWLDRIASNPVAGEPVGRCVLATLMDGKGKLRADVRMLVLEDQILLDVPLAARAGLLRVLDLYIINDDVVVTDLGDRTAWISVIGPKTGECLEEAGLPVPGRWTRRADVDAETAPDPEAPDVVHSEAALAVVGSVLAGEPGVDLLVRADDVATILERIHAAGGRAVTVEALDIVRLEEGVPWFASELDGGVIPLEAVLDDWVSVEKGCYPGQEVVARIRNLGQVARKLVKLVAVGEHAFAPGAELIATGDREGKTAGAITSARFDPTADATRALGFVKRAFWKSGTALVCGGVPVSVDSITDD